MIYSAEVREKYLNIIRENLKIADKCVYGEDLNSSHMMPIWQGIDPTLEQSDILVFMEIFKSGKGKTTIILGEYGLFYNAGMGKPYYVAYKDIVGTETIIEDGKKKHKYSLYINTNTIHPSIALPEEVVSKLEYIIDEIRAIPVETDPNLDFRVTGVIEKPKLSKALSIQCNSIIHGAAGLNGVVGAGVNIPIADTFVITPIQVGMIVALGKVFDVSLTDAGAEAICKSYLAAMVGRNIAAPFRLIPIVGNVIGSATALSLTETIGWLTVARFLMMKQNKDIANQKIVVTEEMIEKDVLLAAFTQLNDEYKDRLLAVLETENADEPDAQTFMENYEMLFEYLRFYCAVNREALLHGNLALDFWNDYYKKNITDKKVEKKMSGFMEKAYFLASDDAEAEEKLSTGDHLKKIKIYSKNMFIFNHNKYLASKGSKVTYKSASYTLQEVLDFLNGAFAHCKKGVFADFGKEKVGASTAKETYRYVLLLILYFLNDQERSQYGRD